MHEGSGSHAGLKGRVGVAEELGAHRAMVWAWCRAWKVHTVLAAIPAHRSVGSGWGAGYGSGSREAASHPPTVCVPLALSSSLTCKKAVSPPPSTGMRTERWPSPQRRTKAPSPRGKHIPVLLFPRRAGKGFSALQFSGLRGRLQASRRGYLCISCC